MAEKAVEYNNEETAVIQHQDSEDEKNLAEIEKTLPGNEDGEFVEYEEEDPEAVKQQEELEDDMEKELALLEINKNNSPTKPAGSYVPAGAMPNQDGKLSKFAREFWFPEARNCPCCAGFKHGCKCCQGDVQTCTEPNCIDSAFTSQVSQDLANRPPPAQAPAPAATGSLMPRQYVQRGKSAPAALGPTFCKFENSPGGCRFGASCRFVHQNPAGSMPPQQPGYAPVGSMMGGPMMMGPGGPYNMHPGYNISGPSSPHAAQGGGAPPKCIYFAQGFCQYGDSCRFSHA